MIKLSTGFVNQMTSISSVREITNNMKIEIRTGTQPTNADAADSGTLLWTATLNSGAYTPETLATAVCNLSTATANPTVFTIGGVKICDIAALPTFTTATDLATNLKTLINASPFALGFKASSSTSTLTITAPKNSGAYINGVTVTITATNLSGSWNFSGGVTCLNGLSLPEPVAGVITYDPDIEVWSGKGLVDGTPAHFRIKCTGGDTGAADSSGLYARIDGNIAQVGGDMTVSVSSVVANKTQLIEEFSITMPQT